MSKGYSFFELLVVIVLIGMLCALTFPVLGKRAQQEEAQQLKSQIENGIDYALQTSRILNQSIGVSLGKELSIFTLNNNVKLLSISLHYHGKLHWRAFPNERDYLLFQASGSADNGSIWYCNSAPVWVMVMNKQGRIRILPNEEMSNYSC